MTSASESAPKRSHPRGIVLLIASFALMFCFLGTPAVQRTQEARVLETAREMLGQPWHGWIIPRLNGELRLAKPPLAYWLAAGAFEVGGVHEGVGRIPFALVGWATLIVTWTIARRLFQSDRVAFYAWAVLLGSFMFARHARLAETDILVTCFVTASIGCILRATEPDAPTRWLALSGVALGFAILAKGIPAIFVILFLLGIASATHDWRLLWRWVRSGAPIFAIVIGLSWFLYAGLTLGWDAFYDEADIATRGGEHKALALQYLPQTLQATAPWSALAVLAIVLAAARWREDCRLRAILIWAAAIIVPLCIGGQKQYHYLFPLMPALAVLTGWLMHHVVERKIKESDLARIIFAGTVVVMLLAALAMPFIARLLRGNLRPIDWTLLALCVICAAVPLALFVRGRVVQAGFTFALAAAVCVTILTELWMPSLRTISPREVASAVRAVGPGPYTFYGKNISLPLLFYLGQVAPRLISAEDLSHAIESGREMIVIAQTKSGVAPPPVPPQLELAAEIKTPDQTFEVYRVRRPEP